MFLPKKWQEKQIELHWDDFTDAEILDSYKESVDWIDTLQNLYDGEPQCLIDKFNRHLSDRVIPQMKKRGLTMKPVEGDNSESIFTWP